jgi:hypothetical protein
MSTRAQIGFYSTEEAVDGKLPEALIYRHSDGYPTGAGAVVPELVDVVPAVVAQRGMYDPEYLAAQTLYRMIQAYDGGASCLGYGISGSLHGDLRFYYAVTPEGVHVFDARDMVTFKHLNRSRAMFFTSWSEPERRRKVEKELKELEDAAMKKRQELESLRRKKLGR